MRLPKYTQVCVDRSFGRRVGGKIQGTRGAAPGNPVCRRTLPTSLLPGCLAVLSRGGRPRRGDRSGAGSLRQSVVPSGSFPGGFDVFRVALHDRPEPLLQRVTQCRGCSGARRAGCAWPTGGGVRFGVGTVWVVREMMAKGGEVCLKTGLTGGSGPGRGTGIEFAGRTGGSRGFRRGGGGGAQWRRGHSQWSAELAPSFRQRARPGRAEPAFFFFTWPAND